LGIDLMEDEGRTVSRSLDESRLVGEIRAFLAEHVTEQLMVSDVCARFWIGQTALMRKFRHETGHSLMEYFMGLKIAEAQRRIGTGTATFTELSEALGFSSVNYFSKVFKQKTGMTPTEYSRYLSRRRVGEE
jgi:AraC-like DNA-binding protein